MKNCPNCNTPCEDNVAFCQTCGAPLNGQPAPNYNNAYAAPQTPEYDHTAEFDAKDISDNKVIAMLIYLMGTIGVIIALLCSKKSPYVEFHLRQGLKFMVLQYLLLIVTALLFWTFIVPFAAVIALGVLSVLEIICFFQVCGGKAVEPAIIRSLKFMK